MTTEDRILELLCESEHFGPEMIAMELVDEDVSRGDYEGCSTELEIAVTEYIATANRVRAELGI